MSFDKPVVVLDNGSYHIKAGFSSDNHPVSIFRTVVGRPKYLKGSYGKEPYDVYIGDEAIAKADDLELLSPVVNGKIIHWDNMERIWYHIFYRDLKVAPEDRAVVLACSACTPMSEKIKCCEVFFETFNTPDLCVQSQSVLALYGSGFTTGISVDLGYDSSDVNPIYEGGIIQYAHMQTKLSGREMSKFITNKLAERNLDFGAQTDNVVEGIKQAMYITKDTASNAKEYTRTYKLPSGEKIDISLEAFSAEVMFQPELVDDYHGGYLPLHRAIVTAALKCDQDLRNDLYNAVVPWGGMATIPGLYERLSLELEELTHRPCNVVTTTEPYTVAWLGGATFANLLDVQKVFVTKKQFEDHGAKIVRNRFV